MYRSPIELRIYEIAQQKLEEQDKVIMQEVREIIPDIDKGELLRALAYDRAQYEKGYFEGKEAAEAERRWIPVTERLPEAFVSVLVNMPGEKPLPTVREGFISNSGVWHSAYFDREPDEVTHWMPMPEPPEGD